MRFEVSSAGASRGSSQCSAPRCLTRRYRQPLPGNEEVNYYEFLLMLRELASACVAELPSC
jgi:hypothetical protein